MIILARFVLEDEGFLVDFNEWYSCVHVPDFVAAPGVLRGRRYFTRRDDGTFEFLAVYEHDGSCHVLDTFRSQEGRAAVEDFESSWLDQVGPPDITVYHEIGVGEEYSGWPVEVQAPTPVPTPKEATRVPPSTDA